ncbi:integrase core domain protein [Ancylostoma caninum]|uniref:Integrase core domain protein n=1 Tax=Ancylostoma caninum TaxID=29170 RepID=A0A368GZX4_ANCCA|nr:integrase core domain protein [Ancylostoma caninum]
MGRRLKVMDFLIEEGDLKIALEDGSTVIVVPKSKRKEVFEEAHKGLVPPLEPFITSKPFEIVCADLLEMSMSTSGMKYVLVIIDHFSEWLGAYALKDKTAATVATAIFQRWICENGRWPRQIHTDQGKEFVNNVIEELAVVAGIKVSTTKGYNSRENGVSERAIGTIQRMLKKKVELADFWDAMLPNVVYAYNVTPHKATGESPFFLLMVLTRTSHPVCYLRLVREKVKEHADAYREKMKRYYDERHDVENARLPKVSDTSALITKIGTEEETLRIQMDLLRVCPEELCAEPTNPRTKRRPKGRGRGVGVGSVNVVRTFPATSGTKLSHFSADREFDVLDEMNCLHAKFRCQGQKLPILDGVPQIDLSACNCSLRLTAGDMIPQLPQPAHSHGVECVLEGARIVAIWQGTGTLAEKIQWILDPSRRRITPRSVALSYAFFQAQCLHISVMSTTVTNGIMRHAPIMGWTGDTTRTFELGWSMATKIAWPTARNSIGKEHRKVLLVIPDNLHRLKFAASGLKDTKAFFYRQFRELHLKKTDLFDDNLGHVILVMPSVEPKPGSWLPLVHAVSMWLQCGTLVYLIAGPRSTDENSWYRVCHQARSHINGFLESHPELLPQVVDKLPVESGVVDPNSPCFAVAVLEDPNAWIAERHARMFYEYLTRQLAPFLIFEKLPSTSCPRSNVMTGAPSTSTGERGYPAVKEGRVSKNCQRRRNQRKKRSEARAAARAMEAMKLGSKTE